MKRTEKETTDANETAQDAPAPAVTSEAVANLLRDPLVKAIQRLLAADPAGVELERQIALLERQVVTVPQPAREPLGRALESLREARVKLAYPALEKIALGIQIVLRPFGVPLVFAGRGARVDHAHPKPEPKAPGRAGRGNLEAFILQALTQAQKDARPFTLSDLKQAAADQGLNPVSVYQAAKILEKKGTVCFQFPQGKKRNPALRLPG